MYQCQLNFAMFCDTGALGITPGNTSTMQTYLYAVFIYFMRIFMYDYDLGITLSREVGFNRVKKAYIKSAYYSVCDNYGVDADESWMHWD